MGSRPRSYIGAPPMPTGRTRRKPNRPPRKACKPLNNSRLRAASATSPAVSDKLEALKNLIPVHIDHPEIKADQLFQETADYIVLLRTQISVLQKLVDFYGSSTAAQPQTN